MKLWLLTVIIFYSVISSRACSLPVDNSRNYDLADSLNYQGLSLFQSNKQAALTCFIKSLSILRKIEPTIDSTRDSAFIALIESNTMNIAWAYSLLKEPVKMVEYGTESLPWILLYHQPIDHVMMEEMVAINLIRMNKIHEAGKYVIPDGPEIEILSKHDYSEFLRVLLGMAGYLYQQIGDKVHADYYHTDYIKMSIIKGDINDTVVRPDVW